MRSSVRHHAGWDPDDVAPDAVIAACAAPVLFVCATGDTFIAPAHAERLHALHRGESELVRCSGGHNSPRPFATLVSVARFLARHLAPRDGAAADGGGGGLARASASASARLELSLIHI